MYLVDATVLSNSFPKIVPSVILEISRKFSKHKMKNISELGVFVHMNYAYGLCESEFLKGEIIQKWQFMG